jgi:hypothetical protein
MYSCNFLKRINKGEEELLKIDPSFSSIHPKTIILCFEKETLHFKINENIYLSQSLTEDFRIAISIFGDVEVNIDSFEIFDDN